MNRQALLKVGELLVCTLLYYAMVMIIMLRMLFGGTVLFHHPFAMGIQYIIYTVFLIFPFYDAYQTYTKQKQSKQPEWATTEAQMTWMHSSCKGLLLFVFLHVMMYVSLHPELMDAAFHNLLPPK